MARIAVVPHDPLEARAFALAITLICARFTVAATARGEKPSIDYALSAHVADWLHESGVGDASFDTFQRNPANPIYRGEPGLEWPVNGWIMEDPVSHAWYAYIGRYPRDYKLGHDQHPLDCIVYRSRDRGKTFERIGNIFPNERFAFEGDRFSSPHTPDVVVVYHDGRYHMMYDWCQENSTWATVSNPNPANGEDSGVAYAWSDKPEGPFIRNPKPIRRTSRQALMLGKYNRAYAVGLVRRRDDWLAFFSMDNMIHQSWSMWAITAKDPAGEWSEPTLLLSPDIDRFFAPSYECFPQFAYDGFVYAPGYGQSPNRNFHTIYRAPIERATEPAAWKVFQHGSVFHTGDNPAEAQGVWGQSVTGFVDKDGVFQVFYPSKTRDDVGTINVASRPWAKPYRDRGFFVTAGLSRALTLLGRRDQTFRLEAKIKLTRGAATLCWHHAGLVGINQLMWNTAPHPLCYTRYEGLELAERTWRIVRVDSKGARIEVATGALSPAADRDVTIDIPPDGRAAVAIDGKAVWQGHLPPGVGVPGVMADPWTSVYVDRFQIASEPAGPATLTYLYTDALLGAGQQEADWQQVQQDPRFRFGIGAISKAANPRAKWNVTGSSFTLWAPVGPGFGQATVLVDGERAGQIDFHADRDGPSRPLFILKDLPPGCHALVLKGAAGAMPVDCLDVHGDQP